VRVVTSEAADFIEYVEDFVNDPWSWPLREIAAKARAAERAVRLAGHDTNRANGFARRRDSSTHRP
jgi:hypothetical protein